LPCARFRRRWRQGDEGIGAYYQPISFDTNCKACHALTFDAALKTSVKVADGKSVPVTLQAPHRLQPTDLDPFLWGVYADAYLGDAKNEQFRKALMAALKGQHQPSLPLPGKGVGAAKQTIDEQVEKAKQTLVRGVADQKQRVVHNACVKCHAFEDPATQQRVKPSNIPVVWQTHAKFNHVSHRAMECRSCHAAVDTATTKDVVMLPDIENCRACHAPAWRKGGQPTGGVRHDCTGCHTYHNGDHAAQGIGAAARNPASQLKSEEFLGARKK